MLQLSATSKPYIQEFWATFTFPIHHFHQKEIDRRDFPSVHSFIPNIHMQNSYISLAVLLPSTPLNLWIAQEIPLDKIAMYFSGVNLNHAFGTYWTPFDYISIGHIFVTIFIIEKLETILWQIAVREGLIPVLNPIGLDMKKPRNYLIVRGLSRIFRFSSVIAAGALPEQRTT